MLKAQEVKNKNTKTHVKILKYRPRKIEVVEAPKEIK